MKSLFPRSWRSRATLLAVTGPKRWPTFPNTPTFLELGYPLDLVGWNGLMAPKGTPKAIVDRLNLEVNKIIQSPDGRARMLELGIQSTGTSPSEFADIVRRDTPRWGAVWKGAAIPAQ